MSKPSRISIRQRIRAKPVFHERDKSEDAQELSQALIKQARKSGHLKLCGRALTSVPDKVWTLLDFEPGEIDYKFDSEKSKDDEVWWSVTSLKSLDLSNNTITEIPGQIQNLSDLVILNLNNNSLTTLPNEISNLRNLTKLNLSYNKLTEIPEAVCKLRELNELNVSHNDIVKVTKNIYELDLLQNLDLSHNSIKKLPPEMGFLTRLHLLNVNRNKIEELPLEIVGLRVLRRLDVTNNELKALPELMGELTKLEMFYAQHNNIKTLPNFYGAVSLKELYLGNNFIEEIPEDFCSNLPHLTILDLRDNKVKEIPDEVSMLQNLTRLDITNNDLTMLPTSLATLSHLVNLQIEGNQIRSIRRDVIQRGTLSILKTLREKLQDDGSDSIANCMKAMLKNDSGEAVEIPDMHAMKINRTLCVSGRSMVVFPDNIFEEARNAGVTSIDFSKNKIVEFPIKIFSLCDALQDLNLSGNLLKSIPNEIGSCIHLRYLDISQNMISELPEEIQNLNYLREIVLSNNRFPKIPECLYSLPSLEILLIRDNKITELIVESSETQMGLSSLKNLAVLDISNNDINHIPPVLGNMTQIRTLEIMGNSFRQPRLAIITKGTESIMSYLRGRIPE